MSDQIEINWKIDEYSNPHLHSNMRFCWLEAKQGLKFERTSGFSACRETFVNFFRREVTKTSTTVRKRHALFAAVKMLPPSVSLVKYKKNIQESVRVLNLLEARQGWSLTRVYFLVEDQKGYMGKYTFITTVVQGSPKWLRAPQLMSLYLLVLRLSGVPGTNLGRIKTLDDLVPVAKKINTRNSRLSVSDKAAFKKTAEYWLPMLDNHQRLFHARSMKENYKENTGFCGIWSLFINSNAGPCIKRKWEKIKKELK